MTRSLTTQALLVLLGAFGALAPARADSPQGKSRHSVTELLTQVGQVKDQLSNARDNLKLVETQYTLRAEPSNDESLLHRFSEGEIQYLLGDYAGASVLFYDLVSDASFRQGPKFAEALFYLSDSLYQQENLIGARLYLRELLTLQSPHYRQALTRYLEIAGRTQEYVGIEDYVRKARELANGELAPELAYVYGKWMLKRRDLPLSDKLGRSRAIFEPLAAAKAGPLRLPAAYFLGIGEVMAGNYDQALSRFGKIADEKTDTDRDAEVVELANLSMGRLYHETGKLDLALLRYERIPQTSAQYADALYESSWTYVKRGSHEKAYKLTELLRLVAQDSTLEPEAWILQGHLLLKLKRYTEATDSYDGVINTYAPVRDEIDALLTVNRDPVAYFDKLLARNERNLDVTQLLPPVALKWATTQQEVADAVRMVDDIEVGRQGLGEAGDIAARILKALNERTLETFPELQEGYARANAVDSAVLQSQESLLRIERELLAGYLAPQDVQKLEALRRQQVSLQTKFASLPTSEQDVADRRKRLQDKVDALDGEAFKLGYELQSLFAVVSAVEKWVEDSRAERRGGRDAERDLMDRLGRELQVLTFLEKDLDRVRKDLQDQRGSAGANVAGEETIRSEFSKILEGQRSLLRGQRAKLGSNELAVLDASDKIFSEIAGLRTRVHDAKLVIHSNVGRRAQLIREKVLAEQHLLATYGHEVQVVANDARNLVGRIAFDSFKRVRQQFYELVLKADVGLLDVAFTRKQDMTTEIQTRASQKDSDLRTLDQEFSEVLEGGDE